MTFDDLNLNKGLINALLDLEYFEPTPIQARSFSKIMSGRDVVGIAQTGTGKTFAYLLPILRLYKYKKEKPPRVLIVVPTRELVLQIVREIELLGKYLNVKAVGVYGGTNIRTQKDLVFAAHDILVSTPGRLVDLAMSRALKLKAVKTLVIDEFDEIMNHGFRVQLEKILDIIPEKRQNLLFSATMSEDTEKIITNYFTDPEIIEITRHGTPLDLIIQKGFELKNYFTKLNFLRARLPNEEEYKKVLLFVRNKKMADRLFLDLSKDFETKLDVIHSNKSQNYRIKGVAKFESGETRILIATDLIARGVDITDITHVINFDLPMEPISYIHRIGRTGRADSRGIAYAFVSEFDQELKLNIEDLMEKLIPMYPIPNDLEISDELIEEEKPVLGGDKSYYQVNRLKNSKGAFHEKKAKNQKTNLGSPFRRKKKQYKKPKKRSGR